MNRKKKIILICVLLIFIGIFVHPEKVIYKPKIIGKISDQNGKPIENATVSRIEEKSWKNKEFGYIENEKFKSQIVKTDINGNFELKEKSPERLIDFESVYETIGMPALIVQVVTGIMLAHRLLPNVSQWFNFANPVSHAIVAKLTLLALTVGFAIDARFRVIPGLSKETLGVMAWHIVPVTLLSIWFGIDRVAFPPGSLY